LQYKTPPRRYHTDEVVYLLVHIDQTLKNLLGDPGIAQRTVCLIVLELKDPAQCRQGVTA
jgi:hypothetical protein